MSEQSSPLVGASRSKLAIVLALCLSVFVTWYFLLGQIASWFERAYGIYVPGQERMGSGIPKFEYGLIWVLGLLLPALVIIALIAARRKTLLLTMGSGVLQIGWVAAFFYGTGEDGCIPGQTFPGDPWYSTAFMTSPLVVGLASGFVLGRLRGADWEGAWWVTCVLTLSTIGLEYVQASTCSGPAGQTTRLSDAWLVAPFFFVPALVTVLTGVASGNRRLERMVD